MCFSFRSQYNRVKIFHNLKSASPYQILVWIICKKFMTQIALKWIIYFQLIFQLFFFHVRLKIILIQKYTAQ